ncbi:hypothetical protein UFOVP71_419 [uncultured Caudovirales phage]|uniref:Uncharacterized protein n=1 Tax=uncultured Caudovirales phage TaxID=2100421 RepID=A0A6J5TB79_9CAUD|nr:hypothetical protein UFOVP71_419 [uncultured Caudovirales phage]
MKAQVPAEGILKRNDWGDSTSYNVPCSCCGTDCEHNVWIEAEDTGVNVTTYTQQKTKWWSMNRFQIIWTLLTKGYVEYEASIIMTEQQALNYAETLKVACKKVKEHREESRKNNATTT